MLNYICRPKFSLAFYLNQVIKPGAHAASLEQVGYERQVTMSMNQLEMNLAVAFRSFADIAAVVDAALGFDNFQTSVGGIPVAKFRKDACLKRCRWKVDGMTALVVTDLIRGEIRQQPLDAINVQILKRQTSRLLHRQQLLPGSCASQGFAH